MAGKRKMALRKAPGLTIFILTLTVLILLFISPFVHSQTVVLSPLPPFTPSTTVALYWSSDSNGPDGQGIDFYTVYKDSVSIAQIDYNGSGEYSFPDQGNLDRQTHYYEVSATDKNGEESGLSNRETTTIDVTAPLTSAGFSPQSPDGNNDWFLTDVLFDLNATDPFEEGSGISATYYCADNNNECTPGNLYAGAPFAVSLEGSVFLRYYSIDNAGNIGDMGFTGPLKIDLSDPVGQGILLNNGEGFSVDGNVTAQLETGEDSVSGLWFCEISWDNGNEWENTGLETHVGPHQYENGLQTALFRCIDFAGRKTTPPAFDEIFVGADENSPEINWVYPDDGEAMSGVAGILADITDEMSGITQVDFYLIEKNGVEYCFRENCHIGDGNTVWSALGVDFNGETELFYADLNTQAFPQGDYNFAYSAEDTSGNTVYLEIGTMIDNTPPRIIGVSILPEGPKARGTIVTIEAEAIDDLSGIYLVEATIISPSGLEEIVELYGDGRFFSGDYETDTDFEPGNYTVEVNAEDYALNKAVPAGSAFELHYSYLVDIFLDSELVVKGETLTVTGVLLNDDGSIVGGYEVELAFPTGKFTVLTDPDTGDFFFDYDTSPLAAEEQEVIASVTAPNGMRTSDTEFFTVTEEEQPEPPPSEGNEGGIGGGGGGSGGGAFGGLSLELSELCTGKEITVTVLGPESEPVSEASVSVILGDTTILENTTDENGKTVFTVDEPGTYEVQALTASAGSMPQTIVIPDCTQEPVGLLGPVEENPGGKELSMARETYARLMDLMQTELEAGPSFPAGFLTMGETNPLSLVLALAGLSVVFIGWKKIFGKKKQAFTKPPSQAALEPADNSWPENPL